MQAVKYHLRLTETDRTAQTLFPFKITRYDASRFSIVYERAFSGIFMCNYTSTQNNCTLKVRISQRFSNIIMLFAFKLPWYQHTVIENVKLCVPHSSVLIKYI